jgi:hypothetical protein
MASEKTHKAGKRIFGAAAALLWLFAAAAALELYTAWRLRHAEAEADAYCAARVEAAFEADRRIIEATRPYAPEPPPHLAVNPAQREAFFKADEKGRAQLARDRREVILVCGRDGPIEKRYLPAGPAELVRFGGLAAPENALMDLLEAAEAEDARLTLKTLQPADFYPPREYRVPMPDNSVFLSEFTFMPLKTGNVAVFVRPSMWETPWLRFRGDMYAGAFYEEWPGSEFWTNAQGYRDSPVAMPKPGEVYRILCIGGSTTLKGPRNDLTWPNMLEKRLRTHFNRDTIEVINCGVYALDTQKERRLFPEYLALEPDLIIQYNFINDAMAHLPGWLSSDSFAADPILSMKTMLRRSRFISRCCNLWLLPGREKLRCRMTETLIDNLRGMFEEAAAAGVPMAFCTFATPDIERMDPRAVDYLYFQGKRLYGWSVAPAAFVRMAEIYNALLEEFCRAHGAIHVPVAENIDGGLGQFMDICHMHLGAMEKKAGIVFEAIRESVAAGLAEKPAGNKAP